MGSFADAVKYLYSQFILRDLLSFITPGAIVVLTIVYFFSHELLSWPIHWLLYIPLFGVFFIVGFAVQCLGEIFGVIRFYSEGDRSSWGQRLRIFWFNWSNDSNIWWKKAHEKFAAFGEATRNDERAQQQFERMVVLKQMCANSFLASFIAGVLFVFNSCPWPQAKLYVISIVAILLILSLYWGFHVHILRQDTLADAILAQKGKQES